MEVIRITKIFTFEMAHSLWNYSGKCKNIHGHSYKLFVTLEGIPNKNPGTSDDGMIIDFGEIKSLINRNIIDEFDHALVINDNCDYSKNILKIDSSFDNIKLLPFQPTSENLIVHFANKIRNILPDKIYLYSLKLKETESSYVEWFAK